jgi:hypothetical protein
MLTGAVPSDLNSVPTDSVPVTTDRAPVHSDLVTVHSDSSPVHTDFAPGSLVTLFGTSRAGSCYLQTVVFGKRISQ